MKNAKIAAKNLLAIAKTYSKATGMTLPAIGREFYGRGGVFNDLRAGKQSVTLTNLDALLHKFSKRWPDDVPWPEMLPLSMDRPVGKIVPKENRIAA